MRPRQLPGIVAAVACALIATATTQAQTEAEHRIERHAEVRHIVRLGGNVNYHSCAAVIPATIIVVTKPAHGTLATRNELVTATHPQLGYDDPCKSFSGTGPAVYCTRTSPGLNKFRYDSPSPNGAVHVNVTVN
jgi:hypothetical protein